MHPDIEFKANINKKTGNWEKTLPKGYGDPDGFREGEFLAKRVLHEAIYTNLALMVNEAADNPLNITNACSIECDDIGNPEKLVTENIKFNSLDDFGPEAFAQVIEKMNLFSALSLRFLLRDIDAIGNTGLNDSKYNIAEKLVLIDLGLADYGFLKERNLLLNKEKNRLPEENSAFEQIFNFEKNVLSKILYQNITNIASAMDESFIFGLHHGGDTQNIFSLLLNQSCERKLYFLKQLSEIFNAYLQVVLDSEFKSKIADCIGEFDLFYNEFVGSILNRVIERAETLNASKNDFCLDIEKLDAFLEINIILACQDELKREEKLLADQAKRVSEKKDKLRQAQEKIRSERYDQEDKLFKIRSGRSTPVLDMSQINLSPSPNPSPSPNSARQSPRLLDPLSLAALNEHVRNIGKDRVSSVSPGESSSPVVRFFAPLSRPVDIPSASATKPPVRRAFSFSS